MNVCVYFIKTKKKQKNKGDLNFILLYRFLLDYLNIF